MGGTWEGRSEGFGAELKRAAGLSCGGLGVDMRKAGGWNEGAGG